MTIFSGILPCLLVKYSCFFAGEQYPSFGKVILPIFVGGSVRMKTRIFLNAIPVGTAYCCAVFTPYVSVSASGGVGWRGCNIVPWHLHSRDATLRWCYARLMPRYRWGGVQGRLHSRDVFCWRCSTLRHAGWDSPSNVNLFLDGEVCFQKRYSCLTLAKTILGCPKKGRSGHDPSVVGWIHIVWWWALVMNAPKSYPTQEAWYGWFHI